MASEFRAPLTLGYQLELEYDLGLDNKGPIRGVIPRVKPCISFNANLGYIPIQKEVRFSVVQ